MASILDKILDGEITSEDLADPCQIVDDEVSCNSNFRECI